jgi:alpha-tubulin suppressor-like RCC1 family protein
MTNYGNTNVHSVTNKLFLTLYPCDGSASQQFTLNANGTITHTSTGLNIDPVNAGTAQNTQLEFWDNNGCGCQVFSNNGTLNGWQAMIVGTNFFCGIRQDNWSGGWCAGKNDYGQLANWATATAKYDGQCISTLGAGSTSGGWIFNINLPANAKIDISKYSDEWKQQYLTTQFIATDGNVYGAGYNSNGKIGDGTSGSQHCITTKMNLPAAALPALDLSARDQYTSYVLGSDGKVYASGMNGNGQIGDGTTNDRLNPVEVQIPRSNFSY